jgi:hypothetical protein
MDKRVPFFLIASVIGFVLAPVADAEHRWVAVAVGLTYAVLAGLVALDAWSRSRSSERER